MPTTRNTVVTLDGFHCVVPVGATPKFPVCFANSYWCPLGPTPGRAWVLLLRRDLDRITNPGSDYHELVIETRSGGSVKGRVAFPKLLLVKSERLAGGKPKDPESLHLVELADKRYLLQQFSDTGIQHFNLRGFAHADDYLDGTEGNTWTSVVGTIWNTMSSQLGSFPGLPSEALIDNVPEDIGLIGINAWSALNAILAKLGCTVSYDPIDDQFQIVALGSEQPGLDEILRGIEKYRDAEPFESNATRFPETIRVYFHNHRLSYGQERDTEHVNNWAVGNHSASIDVPTGIEGTVSGTVLPLWDDLPRLHDEDNVLENASELSTRAANRANSWVNDQQISGCRRWELLEGLVPAVRPGSEVKAVMWRAWGPDHDGTATEMMTHPGLPKQITGGTNLPDGIVWHQPSEAENNFSPPDLSRRTFPNYPRLINVVQVHDTGETSGAEIGPNGDNLFPGRVARYVAGSLTTLDDCWIRFVDDHDNNAGNIRVKNGDYFMGRLSGHETSGGADKPIYTATSRKQHAIFRFETTAVKSYGANVTGDIVDENGATITAGVGLVDLLSHFGPSPINSGGYCIRMPDNPTVVISPNTLDAYEIIHMEGFAEYIEFTLTGTFTGSPSIASITQTDIWGPPHFALNPAATEVHDTQDRFTDRVNGDKGLAVYDPSEDIYVVVGITEHRNVVQYAKAQSLWSDNGGDPKVSVKNSDRDGGNETGAAYDVYLPQGMADMDPNVRTDSVIGWLTDSDGDRVCVTDYLDDRIGTVKMWIGASASVPGGWRILDFDATYDFRGKFVKAVDDGEGPGDTGGDNTHTHDDHAGHTHTIANAARDAPQGINLVSLAAVTGVSAVETHSEEDNIPEYVNVYFIERHE